ncbi:Transposable element Tc3 transposase [Araneus ventricosus]|uniref:Transposable element Tc3 transposase n=1 Tax=Araneus ventricosus TaxID=182803 RepID=A0A4Y2MBY9_ARAVE|nr:Transposable element Tc3 transposase [Araneus ventricosus]
MVWAAFCYNGQVSLHFTSCRQTSQHYVKTLEDNLLPFAEFLGGNFSKTMFRLTLQTTQVWFNPQNIKVLGWPACNPGLNPIENLWGIMCCRVYSNGRKYSSVRELKRFIANVWYEIEPKTMQDLVSSMETRIYELINKNGSAVRF